MDRTCFFVSPFDMKKNILLLSLSVVLFAACKPDRLPDGVLDGKAMASFLSDAYLLESFYAVETHYSYDAMSPEVLRAYDDILAKHHLSREDIERSLDYYSEHPDQYAAIQDSARSILEREFDLGDDLPTVEDTRLVPEHIVARQLMKKR